jgi:predicted metalloprotease with PDZ domain
MAETRIKELEKQQEQLTQGFVMEIRQRDAEIATCRAAATPRTATAQAEREAEVAEAIDIVTFTAEGPLGVEFDQTNSVLKFVSCVEPGSQAAGRLFVGDEVVSVSGVSARNLSWEEMHDVLNARPAVVSVRRSEQKALDLKNELQVLLTRWGSGYG